MKKKTLFNLPEKVKFCSKCVISNQRPSSIPETSHTKNRLNSKYINFNSEGVCDACLQAYKKENEINWHQREQELIKLLDKHRKSDGSYDCIVPGSGGKDSAFQSHILKYKFGMNPLTITWPPILYTEYGKKNFDNWLESGFDNITFTRNPKVMKLLTKLAIENLLHPFQTFILGQKNIAPKIANFMKIPLIFYGENEAEYGNPIAENLNSLRDKSYYTFKNLDKIYIAGLKISDLIKNYKIKMEDLKPYLPLENNEARKSNIEIHYLGYYLKWTPQEAYYYAVENSNFKARPFRTQGTYSKYNSIDDKIDDLHYYTTYIKFGIGRASYDASQEIRNKHISREEGKLLVKKYDGEYPDRYIKEVLDYLDISEDYFNQLCDKFRSPHLWFKKGTNWKLRYRVFDYKNEK